MQDPAVSSMRLCQVTGLNDMLKMVCGKWINEDMALSNCIFCALGSSTVQTAPAFVFLRSLLPREA